MLAAKKTETTVEENKKVAEDRGQDLNPDDVMAEIQGRDQARP